MTTVCSNSEIISFPRQTNIRNIKSEYYDKISVDKINIDFTFTPRTTIPQFSDPSRQSGELNEAPNSTTCTYENKEYELYNVQLCSATHKNFLDTPDADNRIDIVITYTSKNDMSDPRFVILVLPLIIDTQLQVNELYLSGLGGEIPNTILSLGSLFIAENIYYYYTTCLEPKGDKAFVYVNKKGTSISQSLYYKILAQWKLQPLSTLMSDISNDVNNIKQKAQNLLGSITKSNDLTEIQSKLDSASALTQTINYSSIVETWPSYSPYPGIVLNVPSKSFTLDSMKKEGFQNKEGFQSGTGSGGGGSGGGGSGGGAPPPPAQPTTVSLNNVKCVPLDLDGVIDGSGNINFEADGSIKLSDVQKQRDKIRKEVPVVDEAKKNQAFMTTIIVGGSIAGLIITGLLANYIYAWFKQRGSTTPLPSQIHPGVSSIWYYLGIGLILGFCGYLLGVASSPFI